MSYANYGHASACITARQPFVGNSLFAVTGGYQTMGQLPHEWAKYYLDRWSNNAITYTVVSYTTPIGWYDVDFGWVKPKIKYSSTTSRGQNLIPDGWTIESPTTLIDSERIKRCPGPTAAYTHDTGLTTCKHGFEEAHSWRERKAA